jgi:hypothetical protein
LFEFFFLFCFVFILFYFFIFIFFNSAESVYKVPGDDTRFYAVFTTCQNGLTGSAICVFTTADVHTAFLGKFKEQASSSSAWLPVLSSKVPEPRPGQCVNDTQTLPDTVLNFIRNHPLMDEAVSHESGVPVFFKGDVAFSSLVVERLKVEDPVDVKHYTVYYAGTSTKSSPSIIKNRSDQTLRI